MKAQFWNIAKRETENIKQMIHADNHLLLGAFSYFDESLLSPFSQLFQNKHNDKTNRSGSTVSISNLGNFPRLVTSLENVALRAVYGGAAKHKQGSVFNVHITTLDGKMFWSFHTATQVTDYQTDLRFTKLVKHYLNVAIME